MPSQIFLCLCGAVEEVLCASFQSDTKIIHVGDFKQPEIHNQALLVTLLIVNDD